MKSSSMWGSNYSSFKETVEGTESMSGLAGSYVFDRLRQSA